MKYEEFYDEFFNELSRLGNDADVYDDDVKSYYDLQWDVVDAAREFYQANLDIEVKEWLN